MSKDTNNMTVPGGPKVNIKRVDNSLTADDRRGVVDASLNKIKSAPAPRNPGAGTSRGQSHDGGLLNSSNRGA